MTAQLTRESKASLGSAMRTVRKSRTRLRESQRRSAYERARTLTEIVQERRRHIQEELDTLFRRLREEGCPDTGDEGERAAHGLDRELGSARVDQLNQALRQIDNALARHTEGRYGRCVACDAEIPEARLRSLPFTLFCRDCQQAAEETRAGLVAPIAKETRLQCAAG